MLLEKAHSKSDLIPLEDCAPLWYVIYTQCRHEARVQSGLQQKGMEVFLPRVTTLSRRRDRRLLLNVPLFPGYLFIRTDLDASVCLEIFKIPGVVRLLGFNGRPTPVPEEIINSVKAIVDCDRPFYPWPYLQTGSLVRVSDGPLAGAVGFIVGRKEKKHRLIVSMELFQRAVAVELDGEAVERWS